MKKNIFRIIGIIISVSMLTINVDFTALALETESIETETSEEDKTGIIDVEDALSQDFEVGDENGNVPEIINDISVDESNDDTSEEVIFEDEEEITEEDSKEELQNDVVEESSDIEDEASISEEIDNKKSQKELSRTELYEKARKKEGITLTKTAEEIVNPFEKRLWAGIDKNPCYTWDCIYFGAYVQTDTDKDGRFNDEKKEAIKWRVLSVDENGIAFVVSEKVLDQYEYGSISGDEIYWDSSELRSWLNGYDVSYNVNSKDFSEGGSFAQTAFTEKEIESLVEVKLTNNFVSDYELYADKAANSDTYDRIFLLSLDDINNEDYFYDKHSPQGLNPIKAEQTDYAKRNTYDSKGQLREKIDAYFLRTIGNSEFFLDKKALHAYYVNCEHSCSVMPYDGADYFSAKPGVDSFGVGIRPAMYMNLNTAEWAYAGQIESSGISYSEVKVYFDANGGTFDYDYETYSLFAPEYCQDRPKPVREGYTFIGWDKYYSDGTKASTNPDKFIRTDGMYYVAQWEYSGSGSESVSIRFYYNLDSSDAYDWESRGIGGNFFTKSFPEKYYILENYPKLEPYFLGWYTAPEGGQKITLADRVKGRTYLYAHWDTSEVDERDIDKFETNELFNEFWISDVGDVEYTGGKVKPDIRVYYGFKLLTEGKDYTITCSNNVNICDKSAAKAPSVTIKGKGNYASGETLNLNFSILPKSLSNEEGNLADNVSIVDIYIRADGTEKKPVPTVKADGKTLKVNTDFTVKYFIPDDGENEKTEISSVKEAGNYIAEVKGTGKYKGTVEINLYVSNGTDISGMKFSKIKDISYNFDGNHEVCPGVTVTDGAYELVPEKDYVCTYVNNDKVGTASVIITGTDNPENEKQYYGTKTVTFKIVPEDIKGITVTGIEENTSYTGKEVTFENLTVVKNEKTLTEGTDYTVTYEKNVNSGKATVVFKGTGGYKGTVKKTFKITPVTLNDNPLIKMDSFEESVVYTTGGTVPSFELKFVNGDDTYILQKDKDYTVKGTNNKKVNDGTKKKPIIKITGKGNFKGTLERDFVIAASDIDNVTINVSDREYQNKKGKWKSKVTITDTNGKKLKAGRDYDKKITYAYDGITTVKNGKKEIKRYPGETINSKDIIPAGTIIRVDIKGKGNYSGERKVTYRIRKKNISKLKVTVSNFEYTGYEITPGPEDIKVMDGNEEILYKSGNTNLDRYEIVGYKNNVKIGIGEITIKAYVNSPKLDTGNYYGTRTVKFKITPRKIKWWWKKE